MEKPNERRPSTKIQWHPAFDAALQIELGEEAKYLTFEQEPIANGSSDHRKKERRADSK